MSEERHTLDELQRWVQAVVMHPGGAAAGIESAAARGQIAVVARQADRVICRSLALTALERLEIYNRAYFARLLECLREEYSVLAAALGAELFDRFALVYLASHPSQSYTLGHLGARFPEFLAETRPAMPTPAPFVQESAATSRPIADWPEFMIDLARLERTVNEVFDGPGAETVPLLDEAKLQSIAPARWPAARLTCVPCLKLLTLSYPVNDYFTAVRRRASAAIPQPAPAHVAVTRRDYRVMRHTLQPAQHALLFALVEHETVGQAIERAAALSPLADEQLAAALGEWFRTWTRAGFFSDVISP